MTTEALKLVDPRAINGSQVLPLGDDLIVDLGAMLGDAVKLDTNLEIEMGLANGLVLVAAGFIPVLNGEYSNNFAFGKINGVIQNDVIDTLPRATYSLRVRVNSGTGAERLTRTYNPFYPIVLTN